MALFSKLKQVKDLRDQAKTIQTKLAAETVTADARGGKVTVVMDGNQHIVAVDIDESLLDPSKKKEVEEGVRDAVNDAAKKAQRTMVETMRQSGMSLPGMGGQE